MKCLVSTKKASRYLFVCFCFAICCVAASTLAVHNSLWTRLCAELQHAAWCSCPSGWVCCCCILRAATWAANVNAWRLPRLTNSCCLSLDALLQSRVPPGAAVMCSSCRILLPPLQPFSLQLLTFPVLYTCGNLGRTAGTASVHAAQLRPMVQASC